MSNGMKIPIAARILLTAAFLSVCGVHGVRRCGAGAHAPLASQGTRPVSFFVRCESSRAVGLPRGADLLDVAVVQGDWRGSLRGAADSHGHGLRRSTDTRP